MFLTIDADASDLYYDQITQLEGVEYLLTFAWSARESCWYLDVGDQDGNPLASGVKLVVSWPLLRRFNDDRLPPGFLYCVDMTGNGMDIEVPEDLGSRVLLTYITSDDPVLTGA